MREPAIVWTWRRHVAYGLLLLGLVCRGLTFGLFDPLFWPGINMARRESIRQWKAKKEARP